MLQFTSLNHTLWVHSPPPTSRPMLSHRTFYKFPKCSTFVSPIWQSPNHRRLVNIWNVAIATEEMIFTFCSILMNSHLDFKTDIWFSYQKTCVFGAIWVNATKSKYGWSVPNGNSGSTLRYECKTPTRFGKDNAQERMWNIWLITALCMLKTCWNDNILDILGQVKCVVTNNLTCFCLLLKKKKKVATRKC